MRRDRGGEKDCHATLAMTRGKNGKGVWRYAPTFTAEGSGSDAWSGCRDRDGKGRAGPGTSPGGMGDGFYIQGVYLRKL